MGLSVVQGFTKSLAMTVLSEIGDKTFFAAAILAMRYPRRLVLSGCLGALFVMTVLSAVVGWAAPTLIPRQWTHHITTLLFLGFGLWSLWDAFNEGESEELAEVEKELNDDIKSKGGETRKNIKDADDRKKQSRPFLAQFFSPILLKAFSITFFGEWGDRSQLATIGLAAEENPLGVVIGGILGHALCTKLLSWEERAWQLKYLKNLLHCLEGFFSQSSEFNPSFLQLNHEAKGFHYF